MGGGHDVGAGGVHLGVDGEGRPVDGAVAFDDVALVVDEDEIADLMWAKGSANGLTQKWLSRSGSRAVICPATPSS